MRFRDLDPEAKLIVVLLPVILIAFVVLIAREAQAHDPWSRYVEPEHTEAWHDHIAPPEPEPEPEPPAVTTGVEQWRPIVAVYDWNPDLMLDIMWCESRGVPTAASHTDDHGLLQIHYPIWGPHFGVSRADLYDPVVNVDIGYRVFAQQGYTAWVCFR